MYKLRGLLFFILFSYSCTPNVSNTISSPSKINSPSPKVSNSLNPSSSPKPTELPSITPSITISTPNPVVSITPKPIREIQKINVYSDDGTLLNQYNRYKMLLNETKTFKTEIIYKDGVVSIENINWSSNNSNVNVVESGKLETFLNNPLTTKAIITVSSENDPNYKYSFEVNLVDTLINKVPIYNNCGLVSYKEEITKILIYETITNYGTSPDIILEATFNGKVLTPNGNPVNCYYCYSKSYRPRC
jgi:hypothetical protein